MSAKLLQFSSAPSTRVIRLNATQLQWTGLDSTPGGDGFFRSWLLEDREGQDQQRQIRWSAIGGLALAFAVSAGFWAGLGLVISRFV